MSIIFKAKVNKGRKTLERVLLTLPLSLRLAMTHTQYDKKYNVVMIIIIYKWKIMKKGEKKCLEKNVTSVK